jgi:hypothetical protein
MDKGTCRFVINPSLGIGESYIPPREIGSTFSVESTEPVQFPLHWPEAVKEVLRRRGDNPVRLYADGSECVNSIHLVLFALFVTRVVGGRFTRCSIRSHTLRSLQGPRECEKGAFCALRRLQRKHVTRSYNCSLLDQSHLSLFRYCSVSDPHFARLNFEGVSEHLLE